MNKQKQRTNEVSLLVAPLPNAASRRWCAKRVHLSCRVKVPVAVGQAPHGVPSIGLSAELPEGDEQRELSVCREYCRPQGEPHSPKAIQLRDEVLYAVIEGVNVPEDQEGPTDKMRPFPRSSLGS